MNEEYLHPDRQVYLLTSRPVSGLPVKPILCTIADLKACQAENATSDINSTQNAFSRQVVNVTTSEGKPAHSKGGAKAFQYINARWTTQSIFEYRKDDNGKTVYPERLTRTGNFGTKIGIVPRCSCEKTTLI